MLAEDPCARGHFDKRLHGKYIKWTQRQKDTLTRAFMKTGWTTPWVIDARDISIEKGGKEFDTDDPRCVALHAFAVSLAPPSSAGEIDDLPSPTLRLTREIPSPTTAKYVSSWADVQESAFLLTCTENIEDETILKK